MLPAIGQQRPYFSSDFIKVSVSRRRLDLKDSSLKVYLSEALSQGVIHDAGRGWYSRLSEPVPLDPKPVAKFARAVERALPLLDFSCWSTAQINPWMHHLLAQPVMFLYMPGDILGSVGETLAGSGWTVAVNPNATEASVLVRPGPKMVVLRPARSKQPDGGAHQAPVEKILVDLIEESADTSLMDGSEAQGLVETILNRYLVQFASLQSYAERRGVTLRAMEAIN